MKLPHVRIVKLIKDPPPLIMTADEEQWWQETKKALDRRRLTTSLLKATGVVAVMLLFRAPFGRESGFGMAEAFFALTLAIVLGAMMTGVFMWQSEHEIEAQRRRRLSGRRMHQEIIEEGDEPELASAREPEK